MVERNSYDRARPQAPYSLITALFFPQHPLAQAQALETGEEAKPAQVKPRKKPCCVCKMTKRLRDNCIRNVEEETDCMDFIEAHKVCLRTRGFRV